MLRSIREFFRRLFAWRSAASDEDPEEVFEPIDVDGLTRELRLEEQAERYGRADLPATDDPAPDHVHVKVQQEVAGRVTRAFRKANRKLHGIEDAVRARSIEAPVEEAMLIPVRATQAMREEDDRLARRVGELRAERDEARARIERYRTRYTLERGLELREEVDQKRRLRWALLLGVGQAVANAVLFAQGMHYGLVMGLSLAVVLGVFDILAHFHAGRIACRVRAPDLGNLTLGAVFTLLVAMSIPSYTFGLVHLRNGIRTRGLAEGFEQWWPALRADPFGFSDFGSFALLAIGLVCSLLAVAAGWTWDEPVPVLREAGRRVRELDGELAWHHDRRRRLRRETAIRARRALGERAETIERNLQAAEALAGHASTLRENLFAFVRDAERAHDTLVQRYRDENRIHRSSPPPAYFREPPSLRLEHPIELDAVATETILAEQRRLERDFHARLPGLQQEIDTLEDAPLEAPDASTPDASSADAAGAPGRSPTDVAQGRAIAGGGEDA